jgi:hypothetical protein
VSGYVDELAAGWLHELRRDPVRAIEGLQLTVAAHQGGGSPQWLADLAMSLSENHDRATPEAPEAEQWCGYCGNSDPADLVPGPDAPYFGAQADTFCADEDACGQNRERRYPPDMSRVPSWVLDTHRSLSEEEAAGAMVRAVAGIAAREYYLELSAAIEAEPDEPDGDALELSGQQPWRDEPAWWGPAGAYDTRGVFHPAMPRFNNWSHTISGGAHMSHAISGGAPPPGGSGARLSALRAARQQLQAQRQAGQNPPPYGAEPAREGPQGTGVPAGEVQAPDGRPGGGDGQFYQAARGVPQPGPQWAAVPGTGPEPQPAPPRRRGRKLRYTGRRRQAARPRQGHPGIDGSDSFHGGGAGDVAGGPSGAASET